MDACPIQVQFLGFTIYTIVTGGAFTPTKVLQYDLEGAVGSLPDLNEGRRAHACGYYYDEYRNAVLVVTGGYNLEYSRWNRISDLSHFLVF